MPNLKHTPYAKLNPAHSNLAATEGSGPTPAESAIVTYLITYGRHLHGDASGSVHRHRNLPGGPLLAKQMLSYVWQSYDGWTSRLMEWMPAAGTSS